MVVGSHNQLGPYYLIRRVEEQKYYATFESTHPTSGERLTVTAFLTEFGSIDGFRAWFKENIDRYQRTVHPNVARCLGGDIDESNSIPYVVTEHLTGPTLAELLTRNAMPPIADVAQYIVECAEGLKALNREKVYHRDVRPASIQVTPGGTAKLINLGRGGLLPRDRFRLDDNTIVGSPLYLAPEAVMGGVVDHRSDIYSLAAVAYHLFAGQPPFLADTLEEILQLQTGGVPEDLPVLEPGFPEPMWEVIRDAMVKDPAQRYQDYDTFLIDWNSAVRAANLKGASVAAPGAVAQPRSHSEERSGPSSGMVDRQVALGTASLGGDDDLSAIMPAKGASFSTPHMSAEKAKQPKIHRADYYPEFVEPSPVIKVLKWIIILAILGGGGGYLYLNGLPDSLVPSFLRGSGITTSAGGEEDALRRYDITDANIKAVGAAARLYHARNGRSPQLDELVPFGVREEDLKDGYGNPFRIDGLSREVLSNGPDGLKGTADDFQYNWESAKIIKKPSRPSSERAPDDAAAYERRRRGE